LSGFVAPGYSAITGIAPNIGVPNRRTLSDWIGMKPPAAAQSDPDMLASRALDAIGAQRDMPGLSVTHGWSFTFWLFGHGRWVGLSLLLALLVLCLVCIAVAVLRARARRATPWQESVPVASAPGGAASPHLAQAEAHAGEGRFAEAIHELLLQALADIRSVQGTALPPSLTSREILGLAKLAPSPRGTLRVLIGRVEWTFFGLRAAELSDYQAGRADLDQLRQALAPNPVPA